MISMCYGAIVPRSSAVKVLQLQYVYMYVACVVTCSLDKSTRVAYLVARYLPLSVCLLITKKGASWYSDCIAVVYSFVTMNTAHTFDCILINSFITLLAIVLALIYFAG